MRIGILAATLKIFLRTAIFREQSMARIRGRALNPLARPATIPRSIFMDSRLASSTNCDALAEHLARFPHAARAQLEALIGVSERVAQLAHAHPVLFFILATGLGPLETRCLAVRLAVAGFPLADIADAAGLPNCFRRLPPEACRGPLEAVRWSPTANAMLAPHLPAYPGKAANWLHACTFANRACDERFAAWIAPQSALLDDAWSAQLLLPLALFAWHSQHPDQPAGRLIARPWTPRLKLATTINHTRRWLRRLRTLVELPEQGIEDPWLGPGEACGYTFTPLTTRAQILEESRAMTNCVDGYGPRLLANECRLFSITQTGARIATLEIGWHSASQSLKVFELKGPHNDDCPPEVWHAAWRWLALPQNRRTTPPGPRNPVTLDDILAPYRAATANGNPQWARGWSFASLGEALRGIANLTSRTVACVRIDPLH
jgi:hypothetical protein